MTAAFEQPFHLPEDLRAAALVEIGAKAPGVDANAIANQVEQAIAEALLLRELHARPPAKVVHRHVDRTRRSAWKLMELLQDMPPGLRGQLAYNARDHDFDAGLQRELMTLYARLSGATPDKPRRKGEHFYILAHRIAAALIQAGIQPTSTPESLYTALIEIAVKAIDPGRESPDTGRYGREGIHRACRDNGQISAQHLPTENK